MSGEVGFGAWDELAGIADCKRHRSSDVPVRTSADSIFPQQMLTKQLVTQMKKPDLRRIPRFHQCIWTPGLTKNVHGVLLLCVRELPLSKRKKTRRFQYYKSFEGQNSQAVLGSKGFQSHSSA